MDIKTVKESFRIRNNENLKKISGLLEQRWGSPYRTYRENWKKANLLCVHTDFPIHMDLDTIDACNLHCLYCTEEHGFIRSRTKKQMPQELLEGVFKEVENPAGKDRLCSVSIGTLGEPFLFPEKVFFILEKCRKAGVMEKFIRTNGLLLTPEVYKKILDFDLTYLFCSIDAIKPETYRLMRGNDLHKVIDNILGLIEFKRKKNAVFPVIRVSFLETKENLAERDEFIKFWKDKVDIIDIQSPIDYIHDSSSASKISYTCEQPFVRVGIGVEGQIGLCCAGYIMLASFFDWIFPEISIYEAWNSSKAGSLRKAMKEKDFVNFPDCFKCLSRYSRNINV
ncbi:MAG: radical SAM/SPASM domain-containing protein [Candidatus Omnitrophica bacterium]|nr:radical SAM/SPASM domain-containing protein [Candidatus Omnitrophota bacterium]